MSKSIIFLVKSFLLEINQFYLELKSIIIIIIIIVVEFKIIKSLTVLGLSELQITLGRSNEDPFDNFKFCNIVGNIFNS